MTTLLAVPILLHGALMLVDEWLHERRGLGTWERRGHPLDTLTVMACFFFLEVFAPTLTNQWLYLGIAVFSTLFVTKDEWVHATECGAFEQWLHALLFALHPVILFIAFYFWREGMDSWIIAGLPWVASALFVYQLLRWNILWKPRS